MVWKPSTPWTANSAAPYADQGYPSGDRPAGGDLNTPDLLYTSFDSGNNTPDTDTVNFSWAVSSGDGDVSVSTDDSVSGTYSYRFRYLAATEWTEKRFSYDSTSGLWVSYWIKVPTNFTHSGQANLKFFVLYMDGYIQAGTGCTLEVQLWPGSGSLTYAGFTMHNENPSKSAHGPLGNQAATMNDFIDSTRDQGRWMQVVFHVAESSTVSAQDGVLEAWRRWEGDSSFTKFADYTDLCVSAATDNSRWQGGYLMGWANAGYAAQTDWYVDDFSMYSSNPGV